MNMLDQDQVTSAAGRLLEVIRRLPLYASNGSAAVEWQAALDELSAAAVQVREEAERLQDWDQQVQAARAEALAHNLRYQELVAFMPAGYAITDSQGIIQEANQAAARLLGVRRDFLPGKPLPFFVAPD